MIRLLPTRLQTSDRFRAAADAARRDGHTDAPPRHAATRLTFFRMD
jgi:hypothetical protein